MYYYGFIFLKFSVNPLKPFNKENIKKYADKILLAHMAVYEEYDKDSKRLGTRLFESKSKVTKKQVPNLLKKHYNFDNKIVLDYTPIDRRFLNKDIYKNISIYTVLLKKDPGNKKTLKMIKTIKLQFYNLETISKNYDVAQSIINYTKKNKNDYDKKKIELSKNMEFIFVSMILVNYSLRGAITFNDNTIKYILNQPKK